MSQYVYCLHMYILNISVYLWRSLDVCVHLNVCVCVALRITFIAQVCVHAYVCACVSLARTSGSVYSYQCMSEHT